MIKEISLKIFSYLPFYDRVQLSMVSKEFYETFYMIDHDIQQYILPYWSRLNPSKFKSKIHNKTLFLQSKSYGIANPEHLKYLIQNNDIVRLKINKIKLKKTYMNLFRNISIINLSNTNLSNDFDLALLQNVRVLNISKTNVYDVSMLGHLQCLNISYTEVNDISMLGGLKKLIASHTPIKNVHFKDPVKLEKLDISFTDVSNVSHLSNIKELITLETNFPLLRPIRGNNRVQMDV
jgi:glutaredoxin-related protein